MDKYKASLLENVQETRHKAKRRHTMKFYHVPIQEYLEIRNIIKGYICQEIDLTRLQYNMKKEQQFNKSSLKTYLHPFYSIKGWFIQVTIIPVQSKCVADKIHSVITQSMFPENKMTNKVTYNAGQQQEDMPSIIHPL